MHSKVGIRLSWSYRYNAVLIPPIDVTEEVLPLNDSIRDILDGTFSSSIAYLRLPAAESLKETPPIPSDTLTDTSLGTSRVRPTVENRLIYINFVKQHPLPQKNVPSNLPPTRPQPNPHTTDPLQALSNRLHYKPSKTPSKPPKKPYRLKTPLLFPFPLPRAKNQHPLPL